MNQIPSRGSWDISSAPIAGGAEVERSFIRSAYGWMFAGLLITALSAYAVVSSPALQQLIIGTPLFWVLAIAELGMVFFLSLRVHKMNPGTAASIFLAYSALNGLTLSIYLLAYTQASVVGAFVTAAGMFGAMSVFGMVTKRDLTGWGSFFFMGLIGIVIASLVNIFLKSSGLSFVISVLGVFIFVGLTAYDTQKLKLMARNANTRTTQYAVVGALALYLDFINLFIMLLRLFGTRRD